MSQARLSVLPAWLLSGVLILGTVSAVVATYPFWHSAAAQADMKARLQQKAERVKSLIQARVAAGEDVSGYLQRMDKARSKFQARELREGEKLLDQVLADLEQERVQPNPDVITENTQVKKCTANDPSCASIEIIGDERPDEVEGMITIRGYADPSLRTDPVTGELWLSYTFANSAGLDTLALRNPEAAPENAGLSTHLATSKDGKEWTFVRAINIPENTVFKGENMRISYEVSTFTPSESGQWYYAWINYLRDESRNRPAESIRFEITSADSLSKIADSSRITAGGTVMDSSFQPRIILSSIKGAPNSRVWTEPVLFEQNGVLYLLAESVFEGYSVFAADSGPAAEKLLWRFVGNIENIAPEVNSEAEFMSQGDVAMSRDGSTLFIFTSMKKSGQKTIHMGCYVAELESLDNPKIVRTESGAPKIRAIVLDPEASEFGPGACAYDPNSESSILFIRREFDLANDDIRFFMHATGIHP